MVSKWLKRFLLWIRSVVFMALGFYICRDVLGLFLNDTVSMVLSAILVSLVCVLIERQGDAKETEHTS